MASNQKIQEIRERLDIVQVIGASVALKKQGQRYLGLCPFHAEKTPSFSVSPDKGLFYCFGCHAGGDAFAFVMRHEGLDFNEAARRLAERVGIALDAQSEARQARRREEDELAKVNAYAQAFFEHALGAPSGGVARAYLKKRGIPDEVAQAFRLGYGGASGELLHFFESKRVTRALAMRAGLLSEDGSRSLFDGRLIFPVFDTLGRLAGFGGRRLGDSAAPKYINTRDSMLFRKRRLLYGWEHAERAVRRSRRVVLVEGYTDVISCHMAGVGEAVAALGTSFTDEHASSLARLAKSAVVLLDGDSAGQAASFKVAERLLAAGLTTKVAALQAGLDPADVLARDGASALCAAVEGATPAFEHFLAWAFAAAQSVDERAAAARRLWPLLAALGRGLEYDLYLAQLAERVGVGSAQLAKHLQALSVDKDTSRAVAQRSPTAVAHAPAGEPQAAVVQVDAVELEMLRELLLYPELRPRLGELAEYALCAPVRDLLEQLSHSEEAPGEVALRCLGDARRAAWLAKVKPAVGDEESGIRAQRTYDDVLARMKARHVDAALKDVIRELAAVEASGGDTGELVRKTQDLTRRKKALLSRHPA